MKWIVSETPAAAERAAADFIAARLKEAIEARGKATFAISGGETPWGMFDCLARTAVQWDATHVFQVDERRVARDSSERNWARFLSSGVAARIPPDNLHPMPVEMEPARRAAEDYARTLSQSAGEPPLIDVVHLGLGSDGHTASLFAGDPLLEERQGWVGVSRPYKGVERLSLTLPVLNQARTLMWFVLGGKMRETVERFSDKDPALPASRVANAHAVLFTDAAAASRP